MNSKILLTTLLIILSSPVFAIMCPANFNQVNIGDSLEEVIKQCGKPDTENKVVAAEDNEPQEWVYYLQVDPNGQATMRTTFAFIDKKLVSMSANGMGISVTQICNGNTVQVGDSQDSVKIACGKPPFVNKGQSQTPAAPPVKLVEIIYNSPTTTTFVFEDGHLKETK